MKMSGAAAGIHVYRRVKKGVNFSQLLSEIYNSDSLVTHAYTDSSSLGKRIYTQINE